MHSTSLPYTRTAQWLHWSMAGLWISSWILGFLATHWRDSLNPHHGLTILHKSLASTLLVLIIVRIFWRLTHAAPALPAQMSPLMQRAAHIGHGLLYLVALIALPVSGWYWSSVADKPILLLGLMPLPPLVAPDPTLYGLAKGLHQWTAWICGVLVSGHVLVALKHHFIDKDEVLRTMLSAQKKHS